MMRMIIILIQLILMIMMMMMMMMITTIIRAEGRGNLTLAHMVAVGRGMGAWGAWNGA